MALESLREIKCGTTTLCAKPRNYKTLNNVENDEPKDTGESSKKRSLYRDSSGNEGASCTKTQAFSVTAMVLLLFLIIALVASFARPNTHCSLPLNSSVSDKSGVSLKSVIPKATNGELFPWSDIRLPAFIVPLHYDILMHPNMTTFKNVGCVNITFQLTEEVDFIVLHIRELNLTKVILFLENGKRIPVEKYLEYITNQQLYVKFGTILEKNTNYIIHIKFLSTLREQLEGFYLSSYVDLDKNKRYLATTHFEPTAARSAFPCFDEPAMKATFQLSMIHDKTYKAYFNSEERETLPYRGDLVVTVFSPTIKMSTYLVAFVVCDYRSLSAKTDTGIMVRVLVPPFLYGQSSFALNASVKILTYFQHFFNKSYPMSKLDLIAIPDFAAGAMENWGLITFRTATILYNAAESASDAQEQVAIVISHEIAHQWFGNLVTMEWWNDLWLNEGFASFVQFLGVNYIHPEWKMMDDFIVTTSQNALKVDSLESSHPIMANVEQSAEIEALFDPISYRKGAAILRMLENFLGLSNLRKGLSRYLDTYQFKNAKTKDLWNCFTEESDSSISVASVMDTWTKQKNYPLVTVKLDGTKVHFKQRRFLFAPPEDDETLPQDISPFGYKWMIPVTFKTSRSSVVKQIWMNLTDVTLKVEPEIQWIKVNVNQTGFYRVMYDEEVWKRLIRIMQRDHKVFFPSDRSNMLDDALTLARAGILDPYLAMMLTKYLKEETEYVPWKTAKRHFDELKMLMIYSPGYLHMERYIVGLLKPLKLKLGWKDEGGHLTTKLRSIVLETLVSNGDEETIQEALELFKKYRESGEKVSPNLKLAVYKAGIMYGSFIEWNFCWNKYQETKIPSEKKLLLSALASTQNTWQLSQLLNYSLDREKIKPQDTVSVISYASKNPIGQLLMWHFVRVNWDQILKRYGQGTFAMGRIILEAASRFTTRFDYEEVKSFFKRVEVGSGADSVKQSLELIRANIHFRDNVEPLIVDWLKKEQRDSL